MRVVAFLSRPNILGAAPDSESLPRTINVPRSPLGSKSVCWYSELHASWRRYILWPILCILCSFCCWKPHAAMWRICSPCCWAGGPAMLPLRGRWLLMLLPPQGRNFHCSHVDQLCFHQSSKHLCSRNKSWPAKEHSVDFNFQNN